MRDDALQCITCREWKWDIEFPWHRGEDYRRGRHTTCRNCHTLIKRAYRERTRVPCSGGCGGLANSADTRPGAKPRCVKCYRDSVRNGKRLAPL